MVRPVLPRAGFTGLFVARGRSHWCFCFAHITRSSPHSYCTCRERECQDSSSLEAAKRHLASVKTPHKTSQLLGKTRQCLEALQAGGRKHDAQAGLELLVPGDICRRSTDGESWVVGERGSQVELASPKEHIRNTTEVVTWNLLATMGNTLLGEIWSHNRLIQVISRLKISLFFPRNQIASLLKKEQLWMLGAGGEAGNTFALPWHASLRSASRLVHPL